MIIAVFSSITTCTPYIAMLYTDGIHFLELELFSISSNSECFDKIYFGNNCLNVYFPRFASTTPLYNTKLYILFIILRIIKRNNKLVQFLTN
ncbi:MAG: hypothetical protein ACI8WT_001926 [Clostridium sp.]|jgi:hypothetical protein